MAFAAYLLLLHAAYFHCIRHIIIIFAMLAAAAAIIIIIIFRWRSAIRWRQIIYAAFLHASDYDYFDIIFAAAAFDKIILLYWCQRHNALFSLIITLSIISPPLRYATPPLTSRWRCQAIWYAAL